MERRSIFMACRTQYSPKVIYRVNPSPLKSRPVGFVFFFTVIDKLILQFTWKCKAPRIEKTTLKKNMENIHPYFETYYKQGSRRSGSGTRTDIQINRREESIQIKPYTSSHLIQDNGAKATQWEEPCVTHSSETTGHLHTRGWVQALT